MRPESANLPHSVHPRHQHLGHLSDSLQVVDSLVELLTGSARSEPIFEFTDDDLKTPTEIDSS